MADLYGSLSQALIRSGEFKAASAACRAEVRYRKHDAVGRGKALFQQGRIQSRLGTYSKSLGWLTRARSALATTDVPEAKPIAAAVAAYYAATLTRLGRIADSRRWAQIAAKEATACGDKEALADAYDVMDTVNLVSGQPTGEYWDRALALYEEIGDLAQQVRILANRGVGLQSAGRFSEAMAAYTQAEEIANRVGDSYSAASAAMNEAEIVCDVGSFAEAEELLRGAVRFFRAAADTDLLSVSLMYLGRVLYRSGRFDEALEALGEAQDGFAAIGATPDVGEVQIHRAECFVLRRDARAALARAGMRHGDGRGHRHSPPGLTDPRLRQCAARDAGRSPRVLRGGDRRGAR